MNQTNDTSPARLTDESCCQLIEQLVAIESFSGNESAASHFLVEQFQQLGYDDAYVDQAGNAVGIRHAQNKSADADGTTVILLGHIDTVPGDIPVRVENGILFGRGSVDAKGPLATFALAGSMCQLPPDVRLVVVGAVEEESATSKGARQISKDFTADYCVIGEPSSSRAITLGYKGRVLIDYSIQVDMGHSAGPDRGAAEFVCEFWQSVLNYCESFNEQKPKLFDQLLPSLRKINSSSDGLTSFGECKIGIRLPTGFDIDAFRSQLNEFADHGETKAQLKTYAYEPAHRGDRSNLLCRALASAIRELGHKPTYKLKTGTADMNVVAPIWECPILAYGPGDSSLDHTPNEHLHLDEFVEAVRTLTMALNRLGESIS